MNKITRENYEEYILDYVDNQLQSDLNQEMELFLNLHPDVASEVLTFRNLKMTPDPEIKYNNLDGLLRNEHVATKSLYSRLLKIAGLSLLLITVGTYFYISEGDQEINTDTFVNSETAPLKIEEKESKKREETTDRETIQVTETITHVVNHEPVTQTDLDELSPRMKQVKKSQHQDTKEQVTKTSVVNGPIYQPRVNVPLQEKTQVFSSIERESSEKPGSTTKKEVRHELLSIASLDRLPIGTQLDSNGADLGETLAFNLTEGAEGSRLKSIIKSTGISRTFIDDISESLRPSLAFTEVQLVPTYLKDTQLEFQRK